MEHNSPIVQELARLRLVPGAYTLSQIEKDEEEIEQHWNGADHNQQLIKVMRRRILLCDGQIRGAVAGDLNE